MKLATIVYSRYLASRGIRRKAWSLSRSALIRLLDDPMCSTKVSGRNLKLPLSHSLPENVACFPFFDRLPRRLSKFLHEENEHFTCIDVGANVGGTMAFFWMNRDDAFLAIEPNPKFRKYLIENWGWNKNVTILPDMCSSESSRGRFVIHERAGTASIAESQEGIALSRRTLDEIVRDHLQGSVASVVKIDTDGHDFEVIAGSRSLLERQPAVLFECDVFGNESYVQDCLRTLDGLRAHGYESILLYDNYGNLMGKYSLEALGPFGKLLFYQLTSRFDYFDILVMQEEMIERFYEREVEHFIAMSGDERVQRTARAAAELMG